MQTSKFTLFDKVIARWRLSKVTREIGRNDNVLDFGCGSQGYFLKNMASQIKEGVGIDYDVKNKKLGNLQFINFKFISKFPEGIGKFDKVVMLAVLEHIDLKMVDKLFQEFGRILKNNGKIILTTPTPISKSVLEMMAKWHILNDGEINDHKKYYTAEDISEIASENKLKLVSYQLFQFGFNSVAVLEKI
jgi:2-polyprenyl-3-methyl-5-hydroxy-6-metoxy-1,4-benzoquinol methylase